MGDNSAFTSASNGQAGRLSNGGSQPEHRVLNFGVVGIGRMGQLHALNILRLIPRAKLVCACSPAKADLEWAETNLIPHGIAVFPTFEEMIQHPRLDAVVIASITELHYEHAKASLQRGIHVLCEKPISQTVEQLQDLISIVQAAPDTRLMVGFTRRFDENYQEAAQKIRQGAIGSPVVIRSQGCEKLEDAPFMHAYVANAARGGGFFVDSFIHDIDLTLSFLEASTDPEKRTPMPRSVCAFGTSAHFKELEHESLRDADNAVGMVQFWGGQIAFHYNSRTAAAGYDNQTEIFGTQGKISVNLVSKRNRLELSDTKGVHVSALPSWYDRYKPSFVSEVIAFTDAVLEKKPMPISLESCVTSLKIAQALQETRHVKCDDKIPRCQRCEAKGIDCVRTPRATVFRKGTLAGHDADFPTSQNWVNSRPRKFYIHTQSAEEGCGSVNQPPERRIITASSSPSHTDNSVDAVTSDSPLFGSTASEPRLTDRISPETIPSRHYYSPQGSRSFTGPEEDQSFQPCIECPLAPRPSNESCPSRQDATEACLLRYFIEELAHWFDTCDPLRHFQLVVPQRARDCPPLRNAIFAVSARHLARVPRYQTEQGIVYYGQLLPGLTRCTGVEYALKCIPFLQNFHTIQDDEYQENLMAATVILRQYEEIEDEQEEEEMVAESHLSDSRTDVDKQVNFLAIIQEIIRIAKSAPTSRSLASAAFVISVRQEVYCAFTRERAPQIHVDRNSWEGMSLPNKVVMHAAEVMKWRWGKQREGEWRRLKEQHFQLVNASTRSLVPILERAADKTRREVFPTKWYCSDAEVVAAQHLDLVKMILIAENPRIEMAPHALMARRQAEAQVRELVLNICGIGSCHPRSPPALVTAAMAIMAYGDYFTDVWERQALSDVIEKTRRYYAWPVCKAVQRLHLGWELSDGYNDLTTGH